MGISASRIRINDTAIRAIADRSPRLDAMMRDRADDIVEAAESHFLRVQRSDNEWRTSETTPPKYLGSFKVKKVDGKWRAANDDPAWVWVEYGAHAGGKTEVLRYRPLARGLDSVAATHG